MRVIVATVKGITSPAHLALTAEGIEHRIMTPTGMFGYWELMNFLWNVGEGFVLLEHDIVPWPGSIQKLIDCPEDWCVHEYPLGNPPQLLWALGACKFSADFIEKHRHLLPNQLRWEQLDHFPRGILSSVAKPHIHQPAFAHSRLDKPW